MNLFNSLKKTNSPIRKNIKDSLPIIAEAAYWLLFLAAIFTKAFYFQFTSKINALPFTGWLNRNMYVSSICTLLIIAAAVLIVFNRRRHVALLVVHIVLTVILFADTVYFRYYYHPISVPTLYQIGVVDSIGGSVVSLFKPKDVIFLLDLPFMAALFVATVKMNTGRLHILKRLIPAVLMVVIGISGIYFSYSKAYKPSFSIDNNYVSQYMGVLYYHCYDTKNFINETILEDRTLSASEKREIQSFYQNREAAGTKYRGAAKGKNLIIIQVEALQDFVIGRSIDGQEITPNLNKLMKEGTYFSNFYYQIGDGNTSDAEFLVNTSLYPIRQGSVNFRYPGNNYHSLPKMLNEEGYNTYAFHANRPSFWNRAVMFKSLGFKEFHTNSSFEMNEKVGWGLSDWSFFKQSLSLIDTGKPFYSLLLTLSSHFPYNFDYSSKSSLNPGKYKGSVLGQYFMGANYADICIGEFIRDLKSQGLYDNSLLVVYGDHYAIPKHDTTDLDEFLGFTYSEFEWQKIQKVPLIIRCPGVEEGKTIVTTGGEIDILPTIANLMELDAPYAIGKDLLNAKTGYALLRNGSLVTDEYIYMSGLSGAFDIETGERYTDNHYEQDLSRYRKEYDISQIIVEKNGLKK
ncbi:phosphoglycerol transferase MdoB-like AlkP superfamily enzyme [Anaerobacterium chartisolvens]|uniref:Phosphoglycerol transferase MdoB-like AlkP superfamily enzyme n=1 Tax=Anaerobacterium chartisolvens TaxID=1297424 RepID=A0A369BHS9_9FIRM|nr:LTA synthase family protein [Anaerobacterium chartisolvens]RCX20017.1 phosphoglycerol transferase MdoB-like AlkP superfamily enzyme [Anaerobacterium chartisolvens]